MFKEKKFNFQEDIGNMKKGQEKATFPKVGGLVNN